MQSTDKLIYALLTAMTLSLAGCGGSSSKTAGTPADPPEPTELSSLQADAKTAATGAATAATGATTAVADVIPLQTTGMEDGYHKAESLVQKDKAMAESVKAKEASDNAADATTEAAAKTAKDAAEAARTAAEAARDEAVKAAMMDVKYAGDMYKVGEHSITPDALKKVITTTMADGKVKTQTIGSRDISLRGAPISATLKTDDTQDFVVGAYTDSNDDTTRLRLMDKYVGTKKGTIYSIRFSKSAPPVHVTKPTITKENPHGTVDGEKIFREDGEFYKVQLPDSLKKGDNRIGTPGVLDRIWFPALSALTPENLASAKVESNLKDGNADEDTGIYSTTLKRDFTFGNGPTLKANEKWYLKRLVPSRGIDEEGVALYELVSVLKDVTFPVAKSYEHMNYGLWASLKEDGEMPSELGKGFVRILDGKSMTADMQTKGTATYHGHWVANVRKAHAQGTGDIVEMEGWSKTNANFATKAITVDLLKKDSATAKFASLTGGTISGNRFKGTGVNVATNDLGLKTGTGKYTEGDSGFSGAFFGPDAVEVGGVFHFTSKDKKDGEFTGAFGGRKM